MEVEVEALDLETSIFTPNQAIKEKIIELVTQRIPAKFGIQDSDVQVLCPMYKGVLGIDQLNYLGSLRTH